MEGNKRKALFALGALAATATGIFCWANFARAADSPYAGLTISEIMYNPAGNNSDHSKWIELANLSAETIFLTPTGSETASGWKIKDLKLSDPSNHYLYVQTGAPIELDPGDFLIIADNLSKFESDYSDFKNITVAKSAITLTTADPSGYYNLTLYDNSNILESIRYSKDWYSNTDDKGKTLEKIDLNSGNSEENWQESCEEGGSPGEEAAICAEEPAPPEENPSDAETPSDGKENISSASDIYLNEILPNPEKDSNDEYIEIANGENEPVDLIGWMIRDASKTGKYVFKEEVIIDPGEYFTIYRPLSKLALNNSAESVTLFNPQGEIISSVSWDKSIKNSSYNFDGKNWRWSKYLTPGEENKFDSEPSVKIERPKHAYKNLYTEFSASKPRTRKQKN